MRWSFTLIELLIVIAIIAILSVVVVLALNPAELLRQARDSRRLSEIESLNSALSLAELGGLNLGNASTTYISIADPAATSTAGTNCAGLGLTPPSGWNYKCAASSTLRLVTGTGWIPVDLSLLSHGSPLAQLPVDPVNTTSTGLYYTYTPGGSYELTAFLEAQKSTAQEAGDGGIYDSVYQTGSVLNRTPLIRSNHLVAHWTFDEGSGTTAADGTGNSNTGTLVNGPSWLTSGSCRIGGCLNFDGANDYVNIANLPDIRFTNGTVDQPLSISAWVFLDTLGIYNEIVLKASSSSEYNYLFSVNPSNKLAFIHYEQPAVDHIRQTSDATMSAGQWLHLAMTYDGSGATAGMKLYVNGAQASSTGDTSGGYSTHGSGAEFHIGGYTAWGFTDGRIDDVRIYNRALSASEIAAIYNAAP